MHTSDRPHCVRRIGSATRQVVLALLLIAIAGFVAFMAYNRNEKTPPPPELGERDMPTPGPRVGDSANGVAREGLPSPGPGDSPAMNESVPTSFALDVGQLEVLDYISEGRFMEARAAVALYQKRHRYCPTCEFLHGLSYHKEKRYELARPFFEKAIEMEERYAPTWYFFGWCLYYLGELDESRDAFERHLALDPLEGDSHFGIGLIAMDEGDLETAEARFRKAIELQEQNPRRVREVAKAHARLGDVFTLQDKLEDARRQLFLATELWPDHYEAQFKLARVLYRLGEDEAAGEAMKRFETMQERVEGIEAAREGGAEETGEDEHEVGP
jgi:hypothetical protein